MMQHKKSSFNKLLMVFIATLYLATSVFGAIFANQLKVYAAPSARSQLEMVKAAQYIIWCLDESGWTGRGERSANSLEEWAIWDRRKDNRFVLGYSFTDWANDSGTMTCSEARSGREAGNALGIDGLSLLANETKYKQVFKVNEGSSDEYGWLKGKTPEAKADVATALSLYLIEQGIVDTLGQEPLYLFEKDIFMKSCAINPVAEGTSGATAVNINGNVKYYNLEGLKQNDKLEDWLLKNAKHVKPEDTENWLRAGKSGGAGTIHNKAKLINIATNDMISGKSCSDLAKKLNTLADTVGDEFLEGEASEEDDSGSAGGEDNSCTGKAGVMGWIICPIASGLDEAVGWADSQVKKQLFVNEDEYKQGGATQDAWKKIRDIAYVLLIPIMLVMVLSTALGFEVFNAYTVKKVIPRLFVAVILISLSWNLSVLVIEAVNSLGTGLGNIIVSSLTNLDLSGNSDKGPLFLALNEAGLFSGSGVGGAVLGIGAVVAVGWMAAAGTITFGVLAAALGIMLIAIFTLWLVLMLRQVILIVLIAVSPLAIIAWIFPNTESIWKKWWSSFYKLLLIFPIITVLIGLGVAIAVISVPDNPGDEIKFISTLKIFGSIILPYFFIVPVFKWAGSAMGAAAAAISGKAQSSRGKFSKKAADSRAKAKEASKNYTRFKGGGRISRALAGAGGAARNKGHWRNKGLRDAGRQKGGAQLLEQNPLWDQYKDDSAVQRAVADPQFVKDKIDAGEDVEKWQNAQKIAKQINPHGNNDIQKAALAQEAASGGYELDAGQKGYNQLAQSVARSLGIKDTDIIKDKAGNITGVQGKHQGVFGTTMNNMQAALSKSGRADLGGINGGTGYDGGSHLSGPKAKFSLDDIATGNTKGIQAFGAKFTDEGGLKPGVTAKDAAVAYKEVERMMSKGGLSGANQAALQELQTKLAVHYIGYTNNGTTNVDKVNDAARNVKIT